MRVMDITGGKAHRGSGAKAVSWRAYQYIYMRTDYNIITAEGANISDPHMMIFLSGQASGSVAIRTCWKRDGSEEETTDVNAF